MANLVNLKFANTVNVSATVTGLGGGSFRVGHNLVEIVSISDQNLTKEAGKQLIGLVFKLKARNLGDFNTDYGCELTIPISANGFAADDLKVQQRVEIGHRILKEVYGKATGKATNIAFTPANIGTILQSMIGKKLGVVAESRNYTNTKGEAATAVEPKQFMSQAEIDSVAAARGVFAAPAAPAAQQTTSAPSVFKAPPAPAPAPAPAEEPLASYSAPEEEEIEGAAEDAAEAQAHVSVVQAPAVPTAGFSTLFKGLKTNSTT
jgi:hypothetical protein